MFNFHECAKSRGCKCRKVQGRLEKVAIRNYKKDLIITPAQLTTTISEDCLFDLLRCPCDICKPFKSRTSDKKDRELAKIVAEKHERRELTAALCFAGCTFALRFLDKHKLDSIDSTLMRMRTGNDLTSALTEELFQPFVDAHRASHRCPPNNNNTTTSDNICLLIIDFFGELDRYAICFRIPRFKANNLLHHFHDNQIMPFVESTRLNVVRDGRNFYKFKVMDLYCDDDKLKNRLLFRKEIELRDNETREDAKREQDVLEFFQRIAHPNIAEVLFAFREDKSDPARLSLVFDYHDFDLQKILFSTEGTREERLPNPTKSRTPLPRSKLNDWLWIGLLDIFDAVAAVHEPGAESSQRDRNKGWRGAHFDIKPANIIVTSTGQFLLADFGLAYLKDMSNDASQTNYTTISGTPMYAPPPGIYSQPKPEDPMNPKDQAWWRRDYDVWSLACVASEVLAFIIDMDENDNPAKFLAERQEEAGNHFGFWISTPDERYTLKHAVSRRLDMYRKIGNTKKDPYLVKVADQIYKMFAFERRTPITVKECQRELSISVKIDRYFLQDDNDEVIAGPQSRSHVADMRTSFSTVQIISPLRCSLYLSRNIASKKLKMDIDFVGSSGENFIVPSWTGLE
jgi:serine/threonine protein kinase